MSPQVEQLRRSLGEAELEANRLRLEEERLRSSIALYQRRVEAAPRREQEFQAMSREYRSTQQQYNDLLGRQNEAELAESMEQRQKGEVFRVIEPALADEAPAAPKRGRLLVIGFLLSLAASAAFVLVREAFDTRIHTRADVEAHSALPVLVTIPILPSEADRRSERRRFALGSAAVLAALCVIVVGAYVLARGSTAFAMWVSR